MANEKKQNILPAVSDDLMNRIKALQSLYLVDGKPASIEFILDRCVSTLQANIAAGFEDERDDFIGN